MTFVFPSINGTVKPRERSGHVAVHCDGYLVVWGGYCNVSTDLLQTSDMDEEVNLMI